MKRQVRVRTPQAADHLPDDLHPVLRRVYLNRGVGRAEELDLRLKKLLPYHALKDIDAAVDLLVEAITEDGHILIVGDFDADGATSTALSMTALAKMGARRLSYLVPDRFRFGYGLTPEIVAVAIEQKPDLIVTVDNGISSLAGVDAARAVGIKVLITDHHLPGTEPPLADAIVNPNQVGCEFPSKKLAGVGVIFYVMAALRARLREANRLPDPEWSPAELLDLVALGTVADLVPLDGNNRILVQQGLQRIRAGRTRPGVEALIQISQRQRSSISTADLGFALAPRLNAAGRLQDMSLGIECLLSQDASMATELAAELDRINRERRELQSQMQDEALMIVDSLHNDQENLPKGLCVYHPEWHEGVVGLVASKLKERHHRPSIAFAPAAQDSLLKGSARSISGLHIRDVLDRVATLNPGIVEKFGGHAMAAGLTLRKECLDDFTAAFNRVLDQWLEPEQLQAVIESEGELDDSELSLETARSLSAAGPWGQGFPEPVFHGEFEVIHTALLKEKHVKLKLRAPNGRASLDAIAFNAELAADELPTERVSFAYRLDINNYFGIESMQFIVEAFL